MNSVLPDTATELAAVARRALEGLGGVDVARRAEADPSLRRSEVGPALASLGIDDLRPREGEEELAAAAALCEAAGRVALPYPLPGVLLRDDGGLPFAVVPDDRHRVDHGDLFARWRVATLDGRWAVAGPPGRALGTKLGPFVGELADAGNDRGAGAAGDAALHLLLTMWQVLGSCDRAVELSVEHVTGRIQFGKPLAAFQAVQFQLADAAVAVAGLRELALFTLWRLSINPAAMGDALALRLHGLDVARVVLRTCQQLHGAAGFCDEYDVSVISRHVQPALRLPFGAERAADELDAAIQAGGFDGLFPHGQSAVTP